MTNEELIAAWRRKLPNVEPTGRDLSAFALGVETGAALAAEQPQPVCPHIRSSGTGEWATHWCALNGPPSAPEPSEAWEPPADVVDRCAQRMAEWVDGAVWPDSWSDDQVFRMRRDAARVLREGREWLRRAVHAPVCGSTRSKAAAPEPSEAEVAAAMASLYRAMEPAAWPSEDEVTDALRAAAAARNTNPA